MEIHPVDVIQHVLNILILFLILKFLVYKPVRSFLISREERILRQRERAASDMAEAMKLKTQYEASLSGAKEEAENTVKNSVLRAEEEAEKIIENAKLKAEAYLKEAREQAKKERQETMTGLRSEVAAISIELASKILEREVTAADNLKIIDEYFSKVG